MDASILNESLFDGASVYHIVFDLTGETVRGAQGILYTNRTGQTLDDLVLHLYPNLLGSTLNVDEVRLDETVVPFELAEEKSILRVELPEGARAGLERRHRDGLFAHCDRGRARELWPFGALRKRPQPRARLPDGGGVRGRCVGTRACRPIGPTRSTPRPPSF